MRKIELEKFAGEILKAEMTRTIVGGYDNECYVSGTSTCTSTPTGITMMDYDTSGDTHTDSDDFPSCTN